VLQGDLAVVWRSGDSGASGASVPDRADACKFADEVKMTCSMRMNVRRHWCIASAGSFCAAWVATQGVQSRCSFRNFHMKASEHLESVPSCLS
jgi:hypothetical protein